MTSPLLKPGFRASLKETARLDKRWTGFGP
jgi:hypothetical protein